MRKSCLNSLQSNTDNTVRHHCHRCLLAVNMICGSQIHTRMTGCSSISGWKNQEVCRVLCSDYVKILPCLKQNETNDLTCAIRAHHCILLILPTASCVSTSLDAVKQNPCKILINGCHHDLNICLLDKGRGGTIWIQTSGSLQCRRCTAPWQSMLITRQTSASSYQMC